MIFEFRFANWPLCCIDRIPKSNIKNRKSKILVTQHGKLVHHGVLVERTRSPFEVRFELSPEFLHESLDRHCRRVTQWAESAAQHVVSQVLHVIDIFCHTAPVM